MIQLQTRETLDQWPLSLKVCSVHWLSGLICYVFLWAHCDYAVVLEETFISSVVIGQLDTQTSLS